MCIIYDVSLSFTFQVPPVGFLPVCDRRWTRETWWPLVSLLHKLSLDPETLCTCDVVGVCPWYDLRWVSLVGARPIDGRGVLSIFWQFCRFWWSCMSTSTQTSCYVMVILGWGWVGWGGAMTFSHVNLPTHVMLRYCYVLLHLHTHVMLRYGDLLLHLLTHVMLRYGDLLLHLLTHVMLRYGDLLLHLHTHVMLRYGDLLLHLLTHTSCYVMVIFSCTCSHTSCYAMVIFSCTCTHTSCAPLFLQMETVLGSHMPKVWKSNMPKCLIKTKNGPNKCEEPPFFSCPLWQGRKSLTDGGKAFPRRLYDGVNTKELPELEKFVLGYWWRKSLGPLTPHRFLEELCKAVKAMKRFWEEGRKKVLHPKKARTYVKKRSSFGDFQNPIFHVRMRKNDVSL